MSFTFQCFRRSCVVRRALAGCDLQMIVLIVLVVLIVLIVFAVLFAFAFAHRWWPSIGADVLGTHVGIVFLICSLLLCHHVPPAPTFYLRLINYRPSNQLHL